MGWFWADTSNDVQGGRVLPLLNERQDALPSPPPGCPMHNPDSPIPSSSRFETPTNIAPSCPVKASRHPLCNLTPPSRTDHSPQTYSKPSTLSKLNPLNYIPSLSNWQEYSQQTRSLPLQRETSSIPRGDAECNWEYPSPQQMYNAMLRKGYTDTPIEDVESMVAVHNFLNEGAWNEIVEWESIFSQGLMNGWERCKHGEQGLARDRARREFLRQRREALGLRESSNVATRSGQNSGQSDSETKPKLVRFMGRPNDPTPKSRILQLLGKVFPESYNSEPPFDRHDWFVSRQTPNGQQREIRYVIDYYAGGTQETGEPVFYLDIRPALDTPTAAMERVIRWGGDAWFRASGGAAREKDRKQRN